MQNSFIDRVTISSQLKDALDVQSQRMRAIADRVSKASLQNQDGFALPAPANALPVPGTPGVPGAGVDIGGEMTNLADTQLRYEATSKLLAKAYQQIRDSMKDS